MLVARSGRRGNGDRGVRGSASRYALETGAHHPRPAVEMNVLAGAGR